MVNSSNLNWLDKKEFVSAAIIVFVNPNTVLPLVFIRSQTSFTQFQGWQPPWFSRSTKKQKKQAFPPLPRNLIWFKKSNRIVILPYILGVFEPWFSRTRKNQKTCLHPLKKHKSRRNFLTKLSYLQSIVGLFNFSFQDPLLTWLTIWHIFLWFLL